MTSKKVTAYIITAIVFFIIASCVSIWQLNSQSERADIRRNGQQTTAFVVDRKTIQYNSPKGTIKVRPLTAPTKGTLKKFDVVSVFYDKNNYKRVVLNQSDSAFNITMWIVVVKLYAASLIVGFFAYRRKRLAK